jgi:N-acetyl-gamma-glutamyl-phosphate reductase
MQPLSVGVLGGSGFTGLELLRCLSRHPGVRVAFATTRQPDAVATRRFPGPWCTPEEARVYTVDWVFSCLPHGESAPWVAEWVDRGARVIDLSGDFRFPTPELYTAWYGMPHRCPERLAEAALVLPEWNASMARDRRLIANPGCYPTAVWLAVLPLVRAGLIETCPIVVDAKSGVTGAGRTPTERTHFVSVQENFTVYSAGRRHRHVGEIEHYLEAWTGTSGRVLFTAGLLPVRRGLMVTVYAALRDGATARTVGSCLAESYAGRPFVRVRPLGEVPALGDVVGTNRCDIGVVEADDTGWVVLVAVLDNLLKGAGGQAVQTMNLLMGWDETLGLPVEGGDG